MKLKQVVTAVVVGVGLVGFGFWFGSVSASTNDPGSVADPLVSKSYVEQLVARFADKSTVDQLAQRMADKAYVESKIVFQVVNVQRGHAIVGAGGTEIVLRGGKATAIGSALGGLFDATGGTDVVHQEAVKPNHLLVVPRSDGRGLYAATDLILMVKGDYNIKPAGE